MSFFKKGQVTLGTSAPQQDYSQSVNPQKILSDPRFLNDLRNYYQEKTGYSLDDKTLVENFYSDNTWGDLNTLGAAGDAAEALSGTAEQREVMRRLDNVWKQLPAFWQEGGRGKAAIPEIAGAILKDPINFIPVAGAYGKAATVARAAQAAGKSAPILRGTGRGVLRGATAEAALSGGQEAIVNTAEQVRDIATGARDEFSGKELGLSALAGGVLGGAAGGAMGLPAGIAGASQGVNDIKSLRSLGLTDDQILSTLETGGTRALDKLAEQARSGLDVSGSVQPSKATLEQSAAAEAVEAEAAAAAEAAKPKFDPEQFGSFGEDLENLQTQLELNLKVARDVKEHMAKDPTTPKAEVQKITATVNELAALAKALDRAEREAAQIIRFEKDANNTASRKAAEKMRANYEDMITKVRVTMAASDGLTYEQLLARMEKDGFGIAKTPEGQPDKDGKLAEKPAKIMTDDPSTDGPMETPPTSGPDAPDTPPTKGTDAPDGPPPTRGGDGVEPDVDVKVETPPETGDSRPIKWGKQEASARAFLDDSYTEADLRTDMLSGRVTVGLSGQLVRSSIKDLKAIKASTQGSADLKAALDTKAVTPDDLLNADLTPDETLDELLKMFDVDGVPEGQAMVEAITAAANAADLPETSVGGLLDIYANRNNLDKDLYPPSIPLALRGEAINAGVDWRTIKPSKKSKGFRITRSVLNKAIKDAKPAFVDGEVASSARTELNEIVDIMLGENMFENVVDEADIAERIRTGVSVLGRASDYNTDVEDLLALAEFDIKRKGKAEEVTSKDDAEVWNKTELKRIKTLMAAYKEMVPELGSQTRRAMAENTVRQNRGPAERNYPVRSAQKGIDAKTIYTTAGRAASTGKIQGILRRGTPIAKGSDYTTTSGYSVRPAAFGREEAMMIATRAPAEPKKGAALAKAKKQYTRMLASGLDEEQARSISGLKRDESFDFDLVPYTTTGREKVFGAGGKVELKKGDTAWADAVTGRAFVSREFALKARGDAPSVVTAAGAITDDLNSTFKGIYARLTADKKPAEGGNTEARQEIDDLLKELRGRIDKKSASSEAEALPATPAAVPLSPPPPTVKGDKKLIVRSKSNPKDIRIIGPQQLRDGADIFAIIGQSPGSKSSIYENWDVRYAPMNVDPKFYNARKELFESLPVETTKTIAGGRYYAGDVSSLGDPILIEDAEKIMVELSEPEFAQFKAIATALGTPLPEGSNNNVSYRDLRMFGMRLNTVKWPKVVEGQQAIAKGLATIYGAMDRAVPTGTILPNASRRVNIENVETIFSEFSAEELANARRFLTDLGGDPTVSPIFDRSATARADQFVKTQEQSVTRAEGQYVEMPKLQGGNPKPYPRMAVLYHEVAHWAYDNILTPQDRVEFWQKMSSYYDSKGKLNQGAIEDRLYAKNGEVIEGATISTNSADSPQEFFANQFAMWAMQNHSELAIREHSYWRRMTNYVRTILDRYFAKEKIDPNLEPLFAKILPSRKEERAFSLGVDSKPTQKEGLVLQQRFVQLGMIEKDIEDAIRSDSADGTIAAFDELRRHILGVGRNSKEIMAGIGGTGPLLALRGKKGKKNILLRMLNEKLKALDEIISGKPSDLTSIDDGPMQQRYTESGELEGLGEIPDPQAIADLLSDFYFNGYNGKFVPENGVPPFIIQKEKSSVKNLIDSMKKAYSARYGVVENSTDLPSGSIPPSVKGNTPPPARLDGNVTPSGTKRKQTKKSKIEDERLEAQASTDAKTPKNKRNKKSGEDLDPETAETAKTLSMKKLKSKYRKHRGTPRGNELAAAIVAKVKSKPLPAKQVPIARTVMDLNGKELEARLLDAIYEGDSDLISEVRWEMQYRIARKAARKGNTPIIPRIFHKSDDFITREINDSVGVGDGDGIPASAPASVRENLSRMTHRNAEVETTTRTLAYRLYNILGKTDRSENATSNLLGTSDMSRLAGSDPSFSGDGLFGDYKSSDYSAFRRQVRRISATLNTGKSNPDQAIGELMHMIVRSGALEPNETEAIVAAYRSLDASMRKRVEALIGSKYADRSEFVREQAIAEEWFADAVNRYTREELKRTEILEGVTTSDASNISMRTTLDRAIDRAIEYTAYATNGQIGRADVKGRYRRLTFYGDMFESVEKRPMFGSLDNGVLAHPSYAADYARDAINSASAPRTANLMTFTKGGIGFDDASQTVNVFYHGTPLGYAFRRTETNPNAIIRRSRLGNYGPGFYLTANPHVATDVYSKRPTATAMFNQVEELDLPIAAQEDMDFDIWDMIDTRREIAKTRNEYAILEQQLGENEDVTSNTLFAFRDYLDDLVATEQALAESLTKRGLTIDPYVMPMVVKLQSPVDFTVSAAYSADHPMINAIMEKMSEAGNIKEREAFQHIRQVMASEVDGPTAYRELVAAFVKGGRHSDAAQEQITSILSDLGYDGMTTTHTNTLSDGGLSMSDGETYRGSSRMHTSVVLFDGKQAKHVDADYFDGGDVLIYNDRTEVRPALPSGMSGDVISAFANDSIESFDDIPVGQFGELLEQEGASSTITGAMMSMMRKRDLSVAEEQTIRKSGPFKYFERLSTRMKGQGMHWLGDRYREHFPDMNQRFAAKFMPIAQMLNKLPDADGVLKGYFRKSTASVGQSQPKSHKRIVRALRRPDGSRQEKALSADERNIFRQIRAVLANERKELEAEGYHIGNRGPNYLPQVWDQKAIRKNRDKFLEKMKRYYMMESIEIGREHSDAEASAFAQKIMLQLLDEADGGVHIPIKGSTKNSTFENIDYSRAIELEKHTQTGILDELEEFLEDDLDAILVKYLEGSSRRLTSAKRFGVNSHAVSDYLMVANEGGEGIITLLTKNKQFEYDVTAMNPQHRKETATLVDTIRMPFQGKEGEAAQFVDELIAVANTSGPAGARQMLMDIAPLGPDGAAHSVYTKRVDAIIGALQDFKGNAGSIDTDQGQHYVENAMRILMKKPMAGTNKSAMKASRSLRFFNNIALLSFTTLTSLGDVGLPIIRSGSFKSWVNALNELKDPHYREMLRNVGVAMENVVHERMVHLYGAPDNRASHAFFNATLLTPWTDMNRLVAGATGFETFKTMQTKAVDSFKDGTPYAQQSASYKTAHRFLKNYGLSEFLPGGKRAGESLGTINMQTDEAVRMGIIKFADDAIFQPNPNDIPMWAQTPVGQLVFQLKSFPLMMSRMSGHILSEANHGNFKPLMYLASVGPAFGVATLAAKDVVQMRGGEDGQSPELRKRNILKTIGYDKKVHGDEDDYLGWYVESMLVMGGFGILGDVIHSAVSQVDNGAYGQNRMWSTVLGPSFGLGTAAMQVTAGIFDEKSGGSNAKERSGLREFATRIPVLGGIRPVREGIVDKVAGEASDGSGSGGGFSSGWSK